MDGGNSWFFLSSVCYKAVRRAFSRLPPAKKTRLACDVPPKTQQNFECLNSYWFTCTGGRWYVHACESRILTSRPKPFASIGYHIFIPMVFRGALLAGAISTRTVKEYNRQRKLWGWAFLGWSRLSVKTQLCDYMTGILEEKGREVSTAHARTQKLAGFDRLCSQK